MTAGTTADTFAHKQAHGSDAEPIHYVDQTGGHDVQVHQDGQTHYVDESRQPGAELTYLNRRWDTQRNGQRVGRGHEQWDTQRNGQRHTERFQYRYPDIDEYQSEKKLEVIETADKFRNIALVPTNNARESEALSAHKVLNLPEQLSLSKHLQRSWQYFFSPRLHKIILGDSSEATAWFPGHTVTAVNGDGQRGRHYRGSLFYEQYLDLLTFAGGLPNAISGKTKNIQVAAFEHDKSRWPWSAVSQPTLFSVLPDTEIEVVPLTDTDQYLQRLATRLLSLVSKPILLTEQALKLVHRSWTLVDARYSETALQVAEDIVQQIQIRISLPMILPLMFELEAIASMLSCFSELDVFVSGMFAGNWVEVAAVPVSMCRGGELCNEERLFQELLKLPKHRFAPLVLNEYANVSDGNHRLTAVWIWNLLKTCEGYNWDLSDLQFQQCVAAHLQGTAHMQGAEFHSVSVFEALRHLGTFLKDPDKRQILQQQVAPDVHRFNKIEMLPAVFLPQYLSSAVVKDLYDCTGTKIRVQPYIYEFLTQKPNAVLPARGSYHFADCAPLPWFGVLK